MPVEHVLPAIFHAQHVPALTLQQPVVAAQVLAPPVHMLALLLASFSYPPAQVASAQVALFMQHLALASVLETTKVLSILLYIPASQTRVDLVEHRSPTVQQPVDIVQLSAVEEQ
jgi:hypothetical protein